MRHRAPACGLLTRLDRPAGADAEQRLAERIGVDRDAETRPAGAEPYPPAEAG